MNPKIFEFLIQCTLIVISSSAIAFCYLGYSYQCAISDFMYGLFYSLI